MNYKHILSLDPSGDWTKGKGTTGVCHLELPNFYIKVFEIKATDYSSAQEYWDAVIKVIGDYRALYKKNLVVVCEDYILYKDKAEDQINSLLETPRLIGVVQWFCYTHSIPLHLEFAGTVKTRWTNAILEHKGYIQRKGKGYAVRGSIYPVTA
jgi:hypothetical protein